MTEAREITSQSLIDLKEAFNWKKGQLEGEISAMDKKWNSEYGHSKSYDRNAYDRNQEQCDSMEAMNTLIDHLLGSEDSGISTVLEEYRTSLSVQPNVSDLRSSVARRIVRGGD